LLFDPTTCLRLSRRRWKNTRRSPISSFFSFPKWRTCKKSLCCIELYVRCRPCRCFMRCGGYHRW
jgi:hypothetical protein